MSTLVCLFDRSGSEVDSEDLDSLTVALELRGRQWFRHRDGPFGVAVAGPSSIPDGQDPPLVVGSGRVVGVADRFGSAGPAVRGDGTSGDPLATGCAAWALANHLPAEPEQLRDVSGAFVLVGADPGEGWVTLARDHLGSVGLYYYLDSRWLIASTEAAPILRHPAVSDELDERSVAGFLGLQFRWSERSFFREIRGLPPAHWMRVSSEEVHREQYWHFPASVGLAAQSSQEIESQFLTRLRCSLSVEIGDLDPSRVGISLSSGLDSAALAALAPQGVRAFSWVFDRTPEADERDAIATVGRHLDLPIQWVNGDGLHPLCDGYIERFVSASSPHLNAFAALKARLYETAWEEGCARILVGDGGDALYEAQNYWLRDLLRYRGLGAVPTFVRTVRRAVRGERSARLALRRLVPFRRLWKRLGPPRVPWLTEEARSLLLPEIVSPTAPDSRYRHEVSAGAKNAELEREENRAFLRYGIERSNPFWSWPLLEWTMQLPATWLRRGDRAKVLVREALSDRLPGEPFEEGPRGLLGAFFLRGIEENRPWLREHVLEAPRSDWKRYVDGSWVEPFLRKTDRIETGHTVLWYLISYELWYRKLRGEL